MLKSIFEKVFVGVDKEQSTSPAVMRALEAFAGGLQWKSETSGGLEEVWKDDDGRFRHYRAGELEYVRYGSRGQHVRPADSEEARRWFAHGVKAKDCRPFLLSRDLNPEGPEPGSTLCGGYEHWAHPCQSAPKFDPSSACNVDPVGA